MISFSNSTQRRQIKLRLGNPHTATVADLDDWLAGGRSGNYLYFKQDKHGTTTASSKHHDSGFNKKPNKGSRLAFRDMAIGMAQAHVNDQDAAVSTAAQALSDFCIQNGAKSGLQNHKALRQAVHALRLALDARAAPQAGFATNDDSFSHSVSGTLDSPHHPAQPTGSSEEVVMVPELDRRSALKLRATDLRRAVKAQRAPLGDAAKEKFASETAKEFRSAIRRGKCDPQKLVGYYLKSRGRFSMAGKTPSGALAELVACLDDTQLLGLLPRNSVDSFINDVLSLQQNPWDYDSDSRDLRRTLTDSVAKWRSLFETDENPEVAKPLSLGAAKNVAERVRKDYAPRLGSLLGYCLDLLTPYAGFPREQALFDLEAMMENGLLGLLSIDHAQQLIDEFVAAKTAMRSNQPIPF